MEREILKRDFVVESNKIFKYLSYVLFAIAGASLIAYLIIVAVGGYWEQMFDFDDDYLHIFLIALGFLIPAVIFFPKRCLQKHLPWHFNVKMVEMKAVWNAIPVSRR